MDRVVLAAVGSDYRRDDGAGPAVVRRVLAAVPGIRHLGPIADPLELVGRWDDADLAVVVDAVRSGRPPGTVSVIDLDRVAERSGSPPASTHSLGLGRALLLGRALGRSPRRVVVVGVEGADFADGVGLSPPVARAVPVAARAVAQLIEEAAACA